MHHLLIPLLASLILTACTTGSGDRVAVPAVAPETRVGIAYGAVELRQVSLPEYAALSEIFVAGPDGVISPVPGAVWADEPARAVTLELARALRQITRARVAPEPWPFDTRPQVVVDVRVEAMLARTDGVFQLAGQYFVAPREGAGSDRARVFALSAPIAGDSAQAIAAARAATVAQLAEEIAKNGLR